MFQFRKWLSQELAWDNTQSAIGPCSPPSVPESPERSSRFLCVFLLVLLLQFSYLIPSRMKAVHHQITWNSFTQWVCAWQDREPWLAMNKQHAGTHTAWLFPLVSTWTTSKAYAMDLLYPLATSNLLPSVACSLWTRERSQKQNLLSSSDLLGRNRPGKRRCPLQKTLCLYLRMSHLAFSPATVTKHYVRMKGEEC